MREAGCAKALFAGDDETDEDVFRLDKNIFSVLVGMRKNSRACYYLRSQQEMIRLLEEINEAVSAKKCPGNSAQI
jgi:trehalose 6-phosphate phosphatase